MALLLCGILGALFFRSFLPGEILFSNDGPYGAINSAAGRLPGGFLGTWADLNWFGSETVSASPDLSNTLAWLLGPLDFAKFYCPLAVLVLGLSAWVFLRQLGLAPVACAVAAIAATLNSDFFSTAAWGVASQPICFAANFLALAAITHAPSSRRPWVWMMLAGFCVGWGVMEAFDIGAIFSMFTAAYALFQSFINGGNQPLSRKAAFGAGHVALMTVCACFIAVHTLNILIGTQIKGVAGTAQDKQTRQQQWEFATQWSVPKKELLEVAVAGIFGYRMDSPNGECYWGTIGQSPLVPQYVEARDHAQNETERRRAMKALSQFPGSALRFTGSGFYAGALVLVVAFWALCQSFRREGSPFTLVQRRCIQFWLAVAVLGVLLGVGKYSIFYRWFYGLPYVSTIRNPTKFMHVLSWALVILFAYGLHGIWCVYMGNANRKAAGKGLWNWNRIPEFDRRWLVGLLTLVVLVLVAMGIMASTEGRGVLEHNIASSPGFDPVSAHMIAGRCIGAVGWCALFLALSACALGLIFSGSLAGPGAPMAALFLGALVVLDLGRANLPWIIYWDIDYKYATNPIIDLLRDRPYEHRVTLLPYGNGSQELDIFAKVYGIEWVQQLFPCYNIQALDVIMEPRMGQDKVNFQAALPYDGNQPFYTLRTWELSNTRYLLGPAGRAVAELNRQIDPKEKRFRLVQAFDLARKPGGPGIYTVDYAAKPDTNGELGLVEFTGALPRAGLFSDWVVNTNDDATLKLLASPEFDPHKTVLVSDPIPGPPPEGTNRPAIAGIVSIQPNYKPKRMELSAEVNTPSILLVNDRYSPHWHATVNGKPAKLLRCNYLVRGVYLEPGKYDVVLSYEVSHVPLAISVAGVVLALALLAWVAVEENRPQHPARRPPKRPETATATKHKHAKEGIGH